MNTFNDIELFPSWDFTRVKKKEKETLKYKEQDKQEASRFKFWRPAAPVEEKVKQEQPRKRLPWRLNLLDKAEPTEVFSFQKKHIKPEAQV